MDLGEAKRRVEKLLALQGYSTQRGFGWRTRGTKGKVLEGRYYLLPIPCVEGLRALLWPDFNLEGEVIWWSHISLRVGEEGEDLLCGGEVTRTVGQSWKPPKFTTYSPTIEEARQSILRWDMTLIDRGADAALARLAAEFVRDQKDDKAIKLMNAIQRGELSEATISDALSIVQYKYARTRTERFQAALVWRRLFR